MRKDLSFYAGSDQGVLEDNVLSADPRTITDFGNSNHTVSETGQPKLRTFCGRSPNNAPWSLLCSVLFSRSISSYWVPFLRENQGYGDTWGVFLAFDRCIVQWQQGKWLRFVWEKDADFRVQVLWFMVAPQSRVHKNMFESFQEFICH